MSEKGFFFFFISLSVTTHVVLFCGRSFFVLFFVSEVLFSCLGGFVHSGLSYFYTDDSYRDTTKAHMSSSEVEVVS